MTSFKEKYLKGEVTIEDLDDFIDDWHDKYTGNKSLQEFLGLSDEDSENHIWKNCWTRQKSGRVD